MIDTIVTDIEGTTSSLSFVKDVLFPYSRARMRDFVLHRRGEPAVKALLDDARKAAGAPLDDEQLIERLVCWIDEDRKVTPLKALQGLIWEQGFREGDFQGHVYEDAARRLREWHDKGMPLYIFSSGSVHAQKLLFGHTAFGDMTPLFSGYFDTTIGAKREPAAYAAIAREIGKAPAQILFLSDIDAELDAAQHAGMQTLWLVREGPLDPNARHEQARSFEDITL